MQVIHLSSPPKARTCSTKDGLLLRCRLRRGNSGAEGAAPPSCRLPQIGDANGESALARRGQHQKSLQAQC
jgi:hypothetical protein